MEASGFLEVAQGAGTSSSDKEMMREKEDTPTPGRQKRYGSTEVFMDPGFEETVSQLGRASFNGVEVSPLRQRVTENVDRLLQEGDGTIDPSSSRDLNKSFAASVDTNVVDDNAREGRDIVDEVEGQSQGDGEAVNTELLSAISDLSRRMEESTSKMGRLMIWRCSFRPDWILYWRN